MNFEPWYQSETTEYSQIISSRVRLARNLSNYKFHQKLTREDGVRLVQNLEAVVGEINLSRPFEPLIAQDLRKLDEQVFLEKHILSPRYVATKLAKGVFVDMYQNNSIMVNEEDHIRIQGVCPGDNLPQALAAANEIDNLLEEHLDFAFDDKFGYLTACPTNVGTGLRASYMIHLPCLERDNRIKGLLPYLTEAGMTLRGIYGEGTISMGSIYQLSNQVTLGQKEAQIIKNLNTVAETIIKQENQIKDKLLEKRQSYLQDKAYRAYGILAYCRRISVYDAMKYLSHVRLGFLADILQLPKPPVPIYQIMMEVQPGHIHFNNGGYMEETSTEIARANFLRQLFVG